MTTQTWNSVEKRLARKAKAAVAMMADSKRPNKTKNAALRATAMHRVAFSLAKSETLPAPLAALAPSISAVELIIGQEALWRAARPLVDQHAGHWRDPTAGKVKYAPPPPPPPPPKPDPAEVAKAEYVAAKRAVFDVAQQSSPAVRQWLCPSERLVELLVEFASIPWDRGPQRVAVIGGGDGALLDAVSRDLRDSYPDEWRSGRHEIDCLCGPMVYPGGSVHIASVCDAAHENGIANWRAKMMRDMGDDDCGSYGKSASGAYGTMLGLVPWVASHSLVAYSVALSLAQSYLQVGGRMVTVLPIRREGGTQKDRDLFVAAKATTIDRLGRTLSIVNVELSPADHAAIWHGEYGLSSWPHSLVGATRGIVSIIERQK